MASNIAAQQTTRPTAGPSWTADEGLAAQLATARPGFRYRESEVPAYELPQALQCNDGTLVTDDAGWERRRRPETLALFERFVYGRSPAAPVGASYRIVVNDAAALGGAATHRRAEISIPLPNGKPFTFEASVFVPNARRGKVAAFLLINHRAPRFADVTRAQQTEIWPVDEIVARGYATAVLEATSVQADERDAHDTGIIGAMTDPNVPADERWGTVAAWAWGASRVLDWLATSDDIDATRVAVVGHSRSGKAALWAGATDPRFALVVSNGSGAIGAALSRRKFGETVDAITSNFGYWFCGKLRAYADREQDLPVDQHQLLSLIAPRPLYVASADEDLWADPRGEFLSLAHASGVYALYCNPPVLPSDMPALEQPLIRGRVGYHIRRGGHELTLVDWKRFVDFADVILVRRP